MANGTAELKELNKTVKDAVNALKIYMGNSAQVKNMNDKQKEAIEKWFDVAETTEDTQKRQRAFTERARDEQGRFIKKRDEQAKKFMGIAGSFQGMFKGMTSGVTNSLRTVTQGITTHFSNFFQAVKSQFLGLFGEESEWFDILGSIKDGITGFVGSFAKGFMMLFRRTPVWAGKMIKTLKDMYKLQVKQMKMDFLDVTGKKKDRSVWTILATILLGIAAGVGAWLHRYLVVLTRLPIFQKIATMFSKIDDIPFIGKLFKAVKFGFKWLGWPLTLLLSMIDFIRGFASTEGSTFEKVKEGLWKALEGFIELPIRFLGWVFEKVLGWFGVEAPNLGDKMMETMKKGFMMIFDGWALIFQMLGEGKQLMMDAISPIVLGIHNFFVDFWNSAVDWITSKIPDWLPGKEKIAEGLTGMKVSNVDTSTDVGVESPAAVVAQADQMKTESDSQNVIELKKAVAAMEEMNRNSKSDTTTRTLAAMNNQTQQVTTDTQQIPDEIDNGLVSVRNYGGDMD